MIIPPEYFRLSCGSLKLREPVRVDYTKEYWGLDGKSTIEDQCFNVNGYKNKLGETKSFSVLRHCVGETLLDIGCAPGEFLRVATVVGFNCVGIEPCEEYIKYSSERSGAAVIHGIFPGSDLGGATFDTIVAMDVLEHQEDPDEFINKAFDSLNIGGRLVLMLPLILSDGEFDEKNFHPEHINIFSEKKIVEWLDPILIDRWVVGHEIVVCSKQ